MFNKDVETFFKASIISLFAAITIAGFSFMYGKENLFLLLNTNLGTLGDFFFNYLTYLADGAVWVIFLIFIFFKRKQDLILSISALIISTIISQGIKRYVYPIEPRPIVAIKDISQIHTIPNVFVHEVGSFPSGHTTQIFTMFLLFCIFLNNKKILWFGFLLALLVAYSRVYQAQHFPIDVAGGIAAALISVWLSLMIQAKFLKKNSI